MEKRIDIFYIGQNFYLESGTMMGSLYECVPFKRTDWGKLSRYLDMGYMVNIRPANELEMEWAKNKLKELNQKVGTELPKTT